MRKIDLSIIILNYNTRDLLKDCITSINNSNLGKYNIEIIVVDSASADASDKMVKELFPRVKFIGLSENLGFAQGNNRGIRKALGRYILLFNSDCQAKDDTLQKMISFMDKYPKCGAATCRLTLPTGKLDPACHRGFPTPWAAFCYYFGLERIFPKSKIFSQYHLLYKDFSVSHEIDSPCGAFFMVRSEILRKVGKLNEDYFMYAEDLDWAYRIKSAGYKIMFNPAAEALHLKKQSGRSHQDIKVRKKTQEYFYLNNKLFYQKYFEKKYPFIINQIVYLGMYIYMKR